MKIKLTDDLKQIASILGDQGFCCYLVGGAVRNQLLGLEEKDYDLATDALPEDIIRIFRRVIPTGIKHGTVTLLFKGNSYEITTFRVDGKYTDGRRPDNIHYTSDIREDLKRRDFTINSIAYHILDEMLIDPNNGLEDLKNKIIRAIGNPDERFREDGLRPLRACRFAAQLNFAIEENTFQAISRNLDKFRSVSRERIYDELVKTMKSESPSITFRHLLNSGLLEIISSDLHRCVGIPQREKHKFDVFEHLLHTCDSCPKDNVILRFAGLFHDLGKATTLKISDDGEPTFYNHEFPSAELAVKIMKDLKFPNRDIQRIEHLIRHHMFNYTPQWSDAAVRRFISKTGLDYIDDLLILQRADMDSMNRTADEYGMLDDFRKRIDNVLSRDSAFSIKDLRINGNDLHNVISVPKGPVMGEILASLLDSILENPEMNHRDFLLSEAADLYVKIQERLEEKKV